MIDLDININTKKRQVLAFLSPSKSLIIVRVFDNDTFLMLNEYHLVNTETNNKKISSYKSLNAIVKYAKFFDVSAISNGDFIPPTDNTDNKTDTSCFIERSDAVGVVDCVGVAQHSNECRSTSPVEGSAFTEQDNKDFPKWGVTLRGLPLPTQAPPLTAENKNNSFIFRIMNDTHWVVLRHDWDDKNIYIHSAKYQTTFFEMCTQDNEKRSIAVPYTPHNLTLLLSARTCPALIHLAQSLSNDAQEVEQ